MPGQAGYAFVGGGYPLDVHMTFDGQPMKVLWTGSGYEGLFAFGLDDKPGLHSLAVHAVNPATGETADQTATLKVDNYSYPFEPVAIPYRLTPLLDPKLNQDELDSLGKIYAVHTSTQLPSIGRSHCLFQAGLLHRALAECAAATAVCCTPGIRVWISAVRSASLSRQRRMGVWCWRSI